MQESQEYQSGASSAATNKVEFSDSPQRIIPMHMVDERGHKVPNEEVPMTPHPSAFNTPFGSPSRSHGKSGGSIAQAIQPHLEDYRVFQKATERYNRAQASLIADRDSTGVVLFPDLDNDNSSVASNASESTALPSPTRSQQNVMASITARLQDVNFDKDTSSQTAATSALSTQITAENMPGPVNSPASTSTDSNASPDVQGGEAKLDDMQVLLPFDAWTLSSSGDVKKASAMDENPPSYEATAAQDLNCMLRVNEIHIVRDNLTAARTSIQAKRVEGDGKLLKYGKMGEELEDIKSDWELAQKRREWGFDVAGSGFVEAVGKNVLADPELLAETKSTLEFMHDQVAKRCQDLASAQRIIEEKLLLIAKGYPSVKVGSVGTGI